MESGIGIKTLPPDIFKRLPHYLPGLKPKPKKRWTSASDQMSGLTIKILAVNIIAIMILGAGFLYLGQYTDSLIEAELEALKSEARLFGGAISEGAVRPVFQVSPIPFEDPMATEAIKPQLARRMVRRLARIGTSRIRLFAVDGTVLIDSHTLEAPGGLGGPVQMEALGPSPTRPGMSIDELFAQSATRFLNLIPMQTHLQKYPEDKAGDLYQFPDSLAALQGNLSATAWQRSDDRFILTAAAPIQRVKQVMGVVQLTRDGHELERKIEGVRVDVFRVFLGSLGITVMLSIYLSGLISKPLQRLARAAEGVRMGKAHQGGIPDMSSRNDEIGELSLALRDMTHALWARMDTIERFAADVAHEIKNPLTSLRSAVETASRVEDDQSRKKLMDIIQHDVKRLDRLISDISSASRLDAELSRDEMGTVDLKKLLYNLRDAYKKPLSRAEGDDSSSDETNITLNLPTHPVFVRGNEDRLGQVFGNLLSNALSFSPPDKSVAVTVTREGSEIHIQVEDEGPGIPESKIETIFDRFYTERPGHESYGDHSGLGLSISRQIIDAHEGRIWAENRINALGEITGARFIVTLESAS